MTANDATMISWHTDLKSVRWARQVGGRTASHRETDQDPNSNPNPNPGLQDRQLSLTKSKPFSQRDPSDMPSHQRLPATRLPCMNLQLSPIELS